MNIFYQYFLYYFYYIFNFKFNFYFLQNIYCKNTHVIRFALWRDINIQKKYNMDKSKNNFSFFKKKIEYSINTNGYSLTKNNYPYNITNNIQHFIIWTNFTPLKIKNILDNKFNNYIFFKNIEKNKTIKDLEHYHVFTE